MGVINCVDGVAGGSGDAAAGAPELATGGRDGRACVWDPRVSSGPVVEIAARKGKKTDCWAVALGNSVGDGAGRCLCTAYDDGRVALYDLRAGSGAAPLWTRDTGKGICGVAFDRADIEMNKLLTAGIDCRICAYDLRTRHPVRGFAATEAHAVSSEAKHPTAWFARPLPQNREIFATGTGNGMVSVWRYEYPA
jgi:WD40 repeat protein